MSDVEQDIDEYLGLPDDPEMAFATLYQRKSAELAGARASDPGSFSREQYVDILIAFDQVHNLGVFSEYNCRPVVQADFNEFFRHFERDAEVSAQKFMMEAARRRKIVPQSIVILDTTARQTIHTLINSIREKLNELALSENKRESLFNKLNLFAAEVDRNRTRTEAYYALVVETGRAVREINAEIKPLQQTFDRVSDWIEKANKWSDALPQWKDRKKIEGPPKQIASPQADSDLEDEIPF